MLCIFIARRSRGAIYREINASECGCVCVCPDESRTELKLARHEADRQSLLHAVRRTDEQMDKGGGVCLCVW